MSKLTKRGTEMTIQDTIQEQVNANPVVLYIKGTADFPMCGFSGKVVQMLRECGAEFTAHNVLDNDEIRQGIKDFANWPTIPQLYVKGEFIGGCDIMVEMFEKGELKTLLTDAVNV
jgi:monothiol glutaredoxin